MALVFCRDHFQASDGIGVAVRVPSHRDITRSVNEAHPIVLSGSNAEAKRAFRSLAASYVNHTQVEGAKPARKPKRRSIFLRRGRKDS